MFITRDAAPAVEMAPNFWRQTLASGKELMLVLFRMRKGADLPAHRHVHEQIGYVIQGAVDLTVEGETVSTLARCCYLPYSNQLHSAVVIDDAMVVDVFSPPRKDYLPGAAPARALAQPDTTGSIADPRPNVLMASDVAPLEIAPGVLKRALLSGDRACLAELELQGRAAFVPSRLNRETAAFVVEGCFDIRIDDDTRLCGPGASLVAAPDQTFAITCTMPGRVVWAESLTATQQ